MLSKLRALLFYQYFYPYLILTKLYPIKIDRNILALIMSKIQMTATGLAILMRL